MVASVLLAEPQRNRKAKKRRTKGKTKRRHKCLERQKRKSNILKMSTYSSDSDLAANALTAWRDAAVCVFLAVVWRNVNAVVIDSEKSKTTSFQKRV